MIKTNSFTPIRKLPTAQEIDQQVKDAAKAMEGKFLEEMMRQMRSTVTDSGGFIPTTQAEKIFREQLDQQYVGQWADKGGLGLADMIYQQIMDKYGEKMGLRKSLEKPQGPLPLNQNIPVQKKLNGFQFDLQKSTLGESSDSKAQSSPVLAPWSGQVSRLNEIGAQEYLVQIKHLDGLTSQLVYKGRPEVTIGQEVQAGQRLGALSPEAKSLFWTIDVNAPV
jgi:flagellar protein FlgJ